MGKGTPKIMKLNCDLGEGFDAVDAALIPLVDQVSIACGGHAGSEASMRQCLSLAQHYGTEVGAHPSYPDRKNFGRQRLTLAANDLQDSISTQITSLFTLASQIGYGVTYVKPHGALYHDFSSDLPLFEAVLNVLEDLVQKGLARSISLMVPAHISADFISKAEASGMSLIFEGFADRVYTRHGTLQSRLIADSVILDESRVLEQVKNLLNLGGVMSCDKTWVPLSIDSLCVHGDTEGAVNLVKAIRAIL